MVGQVVETRRRHDVHRSACGVKQGQVRAGTDRDVDHRHTDFFLQLVGVLDCFGVLRAGVGLAVCDEEYEAQAAAIDKAALVEVPEDAFEGVTGVRAAAAARKRVDARLEAGATGLGDALLEREEVFHGEVVVAYG